MTNLSIKSLLLFLMAALALSLTSCDDDDNGDILGINLDDDGTVFLSSNTTGTAGVLDIEDSPLEIETFNTNGMDADGIFYDEDNGYVYQVDRTNNILVAYEDVLDDVNDDEGVNIKNRSTSNFSNGRGLAVMNDNFIVAQDASDDNDDSNKLVVYTATDEAITISKTITTDINLWGVRAIGDDLIAVKDNSDSLAVYIDFLSNADGTTVSPDSYIKIDGIVRTHGLAYDANDDVMVLTDVGDAGSDTDGAIIMIRNFISVINNPTVTAADYVRIAGPSTMLGNPVDVAYDEDIERIYVAERARDGGLLLIFNTDAASVGDVAPMMSIPFAGASSIYLHRD